MDAAILNLLHDWQNPGLTTILGGVTWLGSVAVLMPLALWLAWRPARSTGWRAWQSWGFVPAAVGGAAVIAHLVKISIDRARPDFFPPLVPMPADTSFPSAHSMQITAFVLAWLISANQFHRPGPLFAGLFLIGMVGFSRLYLQVHFPSDVIAGIIAGACWVLALRALPDWMMKGR